MRMRRIILRSVACPAEQHFFHTISQTALFSKKKIEHIEKIDFLYNFCLKRLSFWEESREI